jgi:hypothetical protein
VAPASATAASAIALCRADRYVNISIYPDGIVPDLQKRKSAANAVKVASGTAHGVYGANSHGCIVVWEIPFADGSAIVNGRLI